AGTDGPVVRADDGFRAEGPASVIGPDVGHIPDLLSVKCCGVLEAAVGDVDGTFVINQQVGSAAFAGAAVQHALIGKPAGRHGGCEIQGGAFNGGIPAVQPDGADFAVAQARQVKEVPAIPVRCVCMQETGRCPGGSAVRRGGIINGTGKRVLLALEGFCEGGYHSTVRFECYLTHAFR